MKLEDIKKRHSTRSFRALPIAEDTVNRLKAEITLVNTRESGISFRLVTNDSNPFASFNKSYGFFRNASNYIVAVIDRSFNDVMERAGFFGEQLVLRATEMGLGTCFVGGTYKGDKVNVNLRAGQEIAFLIIVGYPDTLEKPRLLARLTAGISHMKNMDAENFYVERSGNPLRTALKKFKFLKKGLEAVACAPSALNKRPCRIWIGNREEEEVVRIGIPEIKERQFIDLGIAKSNFTEACGGFFDWGNGAPYYPEE